MFFLPLFMCAENLYYYSNGKKITLSETSGYTFIKNASVKTDALPKDLKFTFRQENIYLFKGLSSKNLKELAKSGNILPAYKRNGKEKVYASGMVFVKIPGMKDSKAAENWCKSNGLKLLKKFKYAPDWYLASANGDPIKKSVELVEKKIAEQAEPSFFMNFEKRTYIPNDTLFANQWHLYNDGTNTAVTGSDSTHVAEAWDVMLKLKGELGGSTVKLAIIDDGFDLNHEDFQGRFLAGHDFADGDDMPNPGNQDMHGTSVAGVAGGATDNGIGIAGACPNCQLIPIRMKMSGITSLDASAIEAFEWAANAGADIISNSWGPTDGTGQMVDMNQTLKDLVANITTTGRNGLGTIILFAAGNGGESIETDGYASNPNVFAIGATKADGLRASYSDFGNSLDFMASSCDTDSNGGDAWSGGSYIDGIWTTDNMGSSGYNSGDVNAGDALGNYTNSFGGTSSACPLAAGITGLVLFANPNLTKDQVYEIFKETSDKTGADAYDGNGFSVNYGYGRLNACKAVKKAFEMAGTDVADVECGGAINQSDPITPDPGDTGDTGSHDPADTGDTSASPLCGNGTIDANEICDGNSLPCNQFAGTPENGTAVCGADCMSWDKSGCYNDGEGPSAEVPEENENNAPVAVKDDDSGCAVTLI